MTRNRLVGRVAALENYLGEGGVMIIYGENDPDREVKEAKVRRLKGKAVPILLTEADMGCL